ncbi:MAG: hypothetical protein ACETV0_04840 [Nitrososphaeria archaeon]
MDVRILTVAGLALTFFGLFLVFGSTILYLSGNQELIGMLGPIGPGMPPVFFIMVVIGAAASGLGLFVSKRQFSVLRQEQESHALNMIEQEPSNLYMDTAPRDLFTLPEIPQAEPYAGEASTPRQETLEQEAPEVSKTTVMLKVVSRGVDEVCSHCGGINELKATKCSSCGREIYARDNSQPSCPVCGAPLYSIPGGGGRVMCSICFSEMDAII